MAEISADSGSEHHYFFIETSLKILGEKTLRDVYDKLKGAAAFLSLHEKTDDFPEHLHVSVYTTEKSHNSRYSILLDKLKRRLNIQDTDECRNLLRNVESLVPRGQKKRRAWASQIVAGSASQCVTNCTGVLQKNFPPIGKLAAYSLRQPRDSSQPGLCKELVPKKVLQHLSLIPLDIEEESDEEEDETDVFKTLERITSRYVLFISERQTDRQTDRERERERERERDRQTDRQTERDRQTETDMHFGT